MPSMTTSDPETRALVVADQRTVRLDDEGTDIVAVRVEDGSIYVPIRPLCAALGLDASGQIQRIHRREALAEMVRTIAVPTAGGTQDLACLHVEGVPLWLSGIDTSRIKEGLRQKFVHFQRWARTRIAEAFLTETGIGPMRDDMASVVPARPDTSALDQIESFGLALAAFAREQRAFELRYAVEQQAVQGELAHLDREVGRLDTRLGQEVGRLDGRLDRAAEAFAHLLRDVQIRLDGSDVITDAQQSDIKALVQAIGQEMQRRGAPNPYQSIWTSLYKHFRVPTYSRLKIAQYPAVVQWLESYPGGARGTETTETTGAARADAPPSEP